MGAKLFKLTGIIITVLTLSLNLGSAATWTVGSGGNSWSDNVTMNDVTEDLGDHYVKLGMFADNFNDNTENWDEASGTWDCSNGTYWINTTSERPTYKYDVNFTEFTYLVYVNVKDNHGSWMNKFRLIFLHNGTDHYRFELLQNTASNNVCLRINNNNLVTAGTGSYPQEVPYWIKVKIMYEDVTQNRIQCKLWEASESEPAWQINTTHAGPRWGYIGLMARDTHIEWDNIRLYNDTKTSGNLASISKDAEEFGPLGDVWKKISFNANIPTNTNIDIYVKTSFDNGTSDPWTDWTLVQANAVSGTIYDLPLENRERYGQWKLVLKTTEASITPEIHSVSFISGGIVIRKEGEKISLAPNPFTPTHPPYDKVYFNIENPQRASVKLEIYSIKGRLIFKKDFGPSETIYWNGRNNHGKMVEDGGYIYQLKVGGKTYNGILVLAK